MKLYTHLTLNEREMLQKLLSEGKSLRKIAEILERSPSTISREINRNKAKFRPHKKPDNKYWYNYWRAENLYIMRRRNTAHRAILPNSLEWNYIVEHLKMYWSPETICGRWALEYPNKKPLNYSTIYSYIKRGEFPDIKPKTHLRRRGKKMCKRSSNYNTIQPDRIIPEWDQVIKDRTRIGDWEGDTVYGGIGKGLIVTLVDRKSRFLCSGLIYNRDATSTEATIAKLLKGLPVKSISLDNGSEFSEFKKLEKDLKTLVYFAEPHKPWQRGTNENTNDILRFFFPKGYNFHSLDEDTLNRVVSLINHRPRKCLGWKTPYEVFYGVALA